MKVAGDDSKVPKKQVSMAEFSNPVPNKCTRVPPETEPRLGVAPRTATGLIDNDDGDPITAGVAEGVNRYITVGNDQSVPLLSVIRTVTFAADGNLCSVRTCRRIEETSTDDGVWHFMDVEDIQTPGADANLSSKRQAHSEKDE